MARLRIAALGRLRAFDDTFSAEDPLGLGITFEIARRDSRGHQAWMEARAMSDPVALAVSEGMFEGMLAVAGAEDGEQAEAALVKASDQLGLVRRLVASGRVSAAQLMRLKDRGNLDEAIALVKAWSGPGVNDEAGNPAACTPENVRDLLTSDAEITEGEHEGKTLGEVLEPWVLEQATQRTRLARRVAEEASKASAPPSGS